MSGEQRTKDSLCYEHEYPKGGMHVQVWRKSSCPFCKIEALTSENTRLRFQLNHARNTMQVNDPTNARLIFGDSHS